MTLMLRMSFLSCKTQILSTGSGGLVNLWLVWNDDYVEDINIYAVISITQFEINDIAIYTSA